MRELSEGRTRYLEIALKCVGYFGAVCAFLFGLWRYSEEKEKEFKRELWTKQLTAYLEASKAAATLAYRPGESAADSVEVGNARRRFWQLYYGEMLIVEDSAVSGAMVRFGYCLREAQNGNCSDRELIRRALDLGQASRKSVEHSWKERLGTPASRDP